MLNIYKFLTYLLKLNLPILLFIPKIKSFIKKEKSLNSILELSFSTKKVYWLHGASVGELDQCKSLARVIREKEPDVFILQSVFSESVSEKNLADPSINAFFFLPLDFPNSYDKIFLKFQPSALFLAAWDTWPNLLISANKFNCKSYLFCATMNENSGRNKGLARLLSRKTFPLLSGISPTHKIYEKVFLDLSSKKVPIHTCGDSRFDSVVEKIKSNQILPDFQKKIPNTLPQLLILGSTYEACDLIWFPILQDLLNQGIHIWIFPHKIDEKRISFIIQQLQKLNLSYSLYSGSEQISNLCIFDAIGLLAYAYQYASFVYVGGALHNRVHNVIEPAYFGMPIFTGPKIENASEAMTLEKLGALFRFTNISDLKQKFIPLIGNEEKRLELGKIARNFVTENTGASERFYNIFLKK